MRTLYRLIAATSAAVFLFVSCQSADEMPEVGAEDAVLAMEDILLVSGTSMFLLFEAENSEAGEVTNDSESVTLVWEAGNVEAGEGTYTITLAEHTIGEDSVFASDYNGYSMTGEIVLESRGPASNTMRADLTLSHMSPEDFPVQRVVMELAGTEEQDGRVVPQGSFVVNGDEIDLSLMSAAFE